MPTCIAPPWSGTSSPRRAYSVTLKRWCFPVTGCVSYRGYFDEAEARADAAELAAQGYESNVYPVPAYSTLGWMNWAGGDPLLNTFIYYPEGELARLIFHELAHQVVYAKDDTMFNESFATAVERLGGARWLATEASPAGARGVCAVRRRGATSSARWRWRRASAWKASTRRPQGAQRDAAEAGRAAGFPRSSMRSCATAGAATRRAGAATTAGWNRPTTHRSAPRRPTTSWCPASRRCSSARAATGSGFMMPSNGWPPCPRTNATGC